MSTPQFQSGPPENILRIAHLPSSYFPDTLGGTEVYVQSLCKLLEELGHATAVVWHSETAAGLPENAFPLGTLPPPRRSHLYTRFAGAEPRGFRDFLRGWKPDVVHFHAFTLGAGGDHAECCRRENVPYVITYHTAAMSCARGTLLRWGGDVCDGRLDARQCAACSLHGRGWPKPLAQLASLSPLPHRVIADSPLLPRAALPSMLRESNMRWARFFGGAGRVIACADFCRDVLVANGLAPDRIALERQGLPGDDRQRTLRLPVAARNGGPLRLGYFGRINVAKGADLFSAAVRDLRASGVDAVGEWLGPIETDRRWAEAMFAAGAPFVRYAGQRRGQDLEAWIRQQDLIMIPSRCAETGPLTLLEAWDEGTPVVGADRGGIRDFMTAAGLATCLFAPGDASAAAAAVQRMLAWPGPAPVVPVRGMRSLAERMAAIYRRACEPAAENSAKSFAKA
ncbi:MAG TPA: glycosyltransferase [Pirellulales bacterium]|nr:glycosyltransferase [Pirellulales bacterium]